MKFKFKYRNTCHISKVNNFNDNLFFYRIELPSFARTEISKIIEVHNKKAVHNNKIIPMFHILSMKQHPLTELPAQESHPGTLTSGLQATLTPRSLSHHGHGDDSCLCNGQRLSSCSTNFKARPVILILLHSLPYFQYPCKSILLF